MREGLLTTRNSKSERVIKQYGYLSLMSESRVDLQAAKCHHGPKSSCSLIQPPSLCWLFSYMYYLMSII